MRGDEVGDSWLSSTTEGVLPSLLSKPMDEGMVPDNLLYAKPKNSWSYYWSTVKLYIQCKMSESTAKKKTQA